MTPTRTLRALVVAGLAWSIASTVLVQLARIVCAILLARFLTPAEYGLAAMALVTSALLYAFLDLTLGVGLVQRSEITEQDRSTVFWTSTALGLVATSLGIALSGPFAAFYGEPAVQPMLAVLSLTFVLGSIGATHAALLHREMAFRAISLRVSCSTIVASLVGVLFAAAGFGAWALIVQQLCLSVIATTLLWMSMPWRPQLIYSVGSLRQLGSFGAKMFGMRIAVYAQTNADKLLIGRLLGPVLLGTYSLAFNILLSPYSRMLIAVTDTLFPAFSRLQHHPDQLRLVWLRVNRLFTAASAPALIGLGVVAPEFVEVVLGPQWTEVGPVLQIMALGVLAQALSSIGGEVLKARAQAGALLRFSTAEAVALLAGVLVGLRWGILGVATAYAVISIATRAYFVWMTAASVGLSVTRFLASLSGVGVASLALLVATVSVKAGVAGVGPAWLRLAIVVGVGVVVYVPVCLWRVPELRAECVRICGGAARAPDPVGAV